MQYFPKNTTFAAVVTIMGVFLNGCGSPSVSIDSAVTEPIVGVKMEEGSPLVMRGPYRITAQAEKQTDAASTVPVNVFLTGVIDFTPQGCQFLLEGTIANYDDQGRDITGNGSDAEWEGQLEKPPYVEVVLKLYKALNSPTYMYTQTSPTTTPAWELYTSLPTSPGVSPAEYAVQYPAVEPAYNPYGWCSMMFLPDTVNFEENMMAESENKDNTVQRSYSMVMNEDGLGLVHDYVRHEAVKTYLDTSSAASILNPVDYDSVYAWLLQEQYNYPRRDLITPSEVRVDEETNTRTFIFEDAKGQYRWTVEMVPVSAMEVEEVMVNAPSEGELPNVMLYEETTVGDIENQDGGRLLFDMVQSVNKSGATCYEKSIHFLTSYNNYAGIPQHMYYCLADGSLL